MGASSSNSSSQPVDKTPQPFQDLQQPFADVLSNLLGSYQNQTKSDSIVGGYQGPTTTPITGNEQSGLNQLQNASQTIGTNPSSTGSAVQDASLSNTINAGGANANATAATQMGANQNNPLSLADYSSQLQGASQTGAFNADANNPILQAYIQAAQRPTQQALEQTLTRDLPGRFTQAGQFIQPGGSSAFDRAAAIATRGSADALGDIATNLTYKNMSDAQGREATALGQQTGIQADAGKQTQALTAQQQDNATKNAIAAAQQQTAGQTAQSNIKAQDVNTMIQNLNAQALPRLIQDLGVERGMEVYNNNINSILAGLGIAAGTTRPVIANSSSSSSGGVNLK